VLADRAAALLFLVAVGAAVVTLAVWSLMRPGEPGFVLERVFSVLVIACPHALGLAIPLVSLIATTKGARAGILVRDKLALEDARLIDVVLVDKTGTLSHYSIAFRDDGIGFRGPLAESLVKYAAYREAISREGFVLLRAKNSRLYSILPIELFPPAELAELRRRIAESAT
jgi:P-type E1-E2 ATPase